MKVVLTNKVFQLVEFHNSNVFHVVNSLGDCLFRGTKTKATNYFYKSSLQAGL